MNFKLKYHYGERATQYKAYCTGEGCEYRHTCQRHSYYHELIATHSDMAKVHFIPQICISEDFREYKKQ